MVGQKNKVIGQLAWKFCGNGHADNWLGCFEVGGWRDNDRRAFLEVAALRIAHLDPDDSALLGFGHTGSPSMEIIKFHRNLRR